MFCENPDGFASSRQILQNDIGCEQALCSGKGWERNKSGGKAGSGYESSSIAQKESLFIGYNATASQPQPLDLAIICVKTCILIKLIQMATLTIYTYIVSS